MGYIFSNILYNEILNKILSNIYRCKVTLVYPFTININYYLL